MVIKYYGTNDTSTNKASTLAIYFSDAYKNWNPHIDKYFPSRCVWIIPGTIDAEGNDIIG